MKRKTVSKKLNAKRANRKSKNDNYYEDGFTSKFASKVALRAKGILSKTSPFHLR